MRAPICPDITDKRRKLPVVGSLRWVTQVFGCMLLLSYSSQSDAFLPVAARPSLSSAITTSGPATTDSSNTMLHCICINCKWVTSCKAYHFVETKHEQPHISEKPTFEPQDGSPTIHVNVRTIRTQEDREAEIQRMWSEHAAETKLAEAKAAGAGTDEIEENNLHGEQVYDLSPVTTYEYDVVQCADFVEDQGCWVRNMPEEIRKANPDFVPS